MSVLKFNVGRSGAGGAKSDYITRLTAAEGIAFHNLDHLASDDLVEARMNAIAYAETREESELARNKNAPTHYRIIISWEGKETMDRALAETLTYMENQFPDGKAIIAAHQNTDDTHTHVWLETRKTDGRKIQLSRQEYESLDERWTQQYDAAYGTSFAPHYKQLKEETKQYKRDMYEWRKIRENKPEGEQFVSQPIKPERAVDRKKIDYWRAKEMQETGALKELPQPAQAETTINPRGRKKDDAKENLPAQPPSEKEQIVERKVEAYMLDLKLMLRRQREELIKQVRNSCYENLARKGIQANWDKLTEFATSAVDHITERDAGEVRSRIKTELQQGTYVTERIALDDSRGADRVQSILNVAAENTHHPIVEHALEGYEKHLQEHLPVTAAQVPKINVLNEQTGVITHEKSGLGTGNRSTEITIGYEPRAVQRGEKGNEIDQGAERFAEHTEPAHSSSLGAGQRRDRYSEDGDQRIEESEQSAQWSTGAVGDDCQNSREGVCKSEADEYGFDESTEEQRQGGAVRNVSGSRDLQLTESIDREKDSFEDFYERGFGRDREDRESSSGGIKDNLAGIESFSVANIDLFELPKIETFKPQVIANQNAFAEEMMKMFKQNLAAQEIKLTLRAEKIYEAQLKKDGTLPPPPQLEMVAKFNQEKTPERQIATAGKSKLEISHELFTKDED